MAIPLGVAGVGTPLFAALAMAASSLLVVANSSRPVESGYRGGATATGPVGVDERRSEPATA